MSVSFPFAESAPSPDRPISLNATPLPVLKKKSRQTFYTETLNSILTLFKFSFPTTFFVCSSFLFLVFLRSSRNYVFFFFLLLSFFFYWLYSSTTVNTSTLHFFVKLFSVFYDHTKIYFLWFSSLLPALFIHTHLFSHFFCWLVFSHTLKLGSIDSKLCYIYR